MEERRHAPRVDVVGVSAALFHEPPGELQSTFLTRLKQPLVWRRPRNTDHVLEDTLAKLDEVTDMKRVVLSDLKGLTVEGCSVIGIELANAVCQLTL